MRPAAKPGSPSTARMPPGIAYHRHSVFRGLMVAGSFRPLMRKSWNRYRLLRIRPAGPLLAGCDPSQPARRSPGSEAAGHRARALSAASPASRRSAPPSAAYTPAAACALLIQQVERPTPGRGRLSQGKLPEAKAEFDRAVDLMLTSGIDIKSDAQLQDEFDRIVDG
jgi:hypothetical protein